MGNLVSVGFLTSLAALASIGSSIAPAFADLSTPAAHEIEAKEQYCSDGTTGCAAPNQRPNLGNLRFAMFEAFRMTGSSNGMERRSNASTALPDAVLAKCAGAHTMDARGNIHAPTMFAFVGPTSEQLDAGTISGSVSLQNGSTLSTLSTAVVALEISDPVSGDSAVITGAQSADNTHNALLSGAFNISLTGPQFDEIVAGPDANESAPPKPAGLTGTMHCSTGSPTVTTPGAPPPYFENEVFGPIDPGS
jgi:hypothetical protein